MPWLITPPRPRRHHCPPDGSFQMLQRHPVHKVVPALPPTPAAWGVAQRVLWTRLLDVTPTLWRPRPLPLPCKPRGLLNLRGTDVEAETQRWEVLASRDVMRKGPERGLLAASQGGGWCGQRAGGWQQKRSACQGRENPHARVRLAFRPRFAACCVIFFHFWLLWVFIAACDFLAAAHGLSLVAEHGLSRPLARGILVP